MNWVQETYESPKKVIKASVEDENIRINSYKEAAFTTKEFGIKFTCDIDYTFEIQIKDNKIRLIFTPGQIWMSDKSSANFTTLSFFKKNGDIKNSYKDSKKELETMMNDLTFSLYNYINGNAKKSDW